eukprot:CAMPEP_0198116394 /NCGR_PEP_ID=MMETSP1442-20131203/11907_1 /TAXON_ID= /ORGANISM="Craspedostauros australis, Strain CCMP3328" /LENGTH=254 /DNA_ID=CAMNT_0043774191 /DNA_START=133 /DNA_END=895 /DNA_ORIENTATION=+
MPIEASLTKVLDIRFIDARKLTSEAKLNLHVRGYPTAEQEREMLKEAIRLFVAQPEQQQNDMRMQRQSLDNLLEDARVVKAGNMKAKSNKQLNTPNAGKSRRRQRLSITSRESDSGSSDLGNRRGDRSSRTNPSKDDKIDRYSSHSLDDATSESEGTSTGLAAPSKAVVADSQCCGFFDLLILRAQTPSTIMRIREGTKNHFSQDDSKGEDTADGGHGAVPGRTGHPDDPHSCCSTPSKCSDGIQPLYEYDTSR